MRVAIQSEPSRKLHSKTTECLIGRENAIETLRIFTQTRTELADPGKRGVTLSRAGKSDYRKDLVISGFSLAFLQFSTQEVPSCQLSYSVPSSQLPVQDLCWSRLCKHCQYDFLVIHIQGPQRRDSSSTQDLDGQPDYTLIPCSSHASTMSRTVLWQCRTAKVGDTGSPIGIDLRVGTRWLFPSVLP